MPKYFIELSYDGLNYHGWQRQPKEISIQEVIEECLTKLHSNKKIEIVGCGRTDSGVHANHFILHTYIPEVKNTSEFIFKLNCMLPDTIAISNMYPVKDEVHARFNATYRTYRYFINQQKDPFKRGNSWYLQNKLDIDKMNHAAKLLIGEQDFTSFSKINTDVKTNICKVKTAKWNLLENDSLYFEIIANRFLRNMVRAIVGTLVEVGINKKQPEEVKNILNAKDRKYASASAPAKGLFLWKIEYPKDIKV